MQSLKKLSAFTWENIAVTKRILMMYQMMISMTLRILSLMMLNWLKCCLGSPKDVQSASPFRCGLGRPKVARSKGRQLICQLSLTAAEQPIFYLQFSILFSCSSLFSRRLSVSNSSTPEMSSSSEGFVIYINLFKATDQNSIITCLLAHLHCYNHVRTDEPGGSANVAPKKRRRKDASSTYLETNHLAPVDYFDIGYVPGKSSARGTAKVGKQLASSNIGSYGQYHEDNRVVKNKTSGPGGAPRRKSSEFSVGDAAARAKVIKDVSDAPLELRDLEKQKAAPPPVSYAHKSKTSEAFDYAYPADRDKGTSAQLGFQQRKVSGENQDPSNRIYHKEKH
ncbi:wound-responsive family protein [Zea mays]|uniref:Wound-responsive family protein n=1 Tax=Zea mays TaxID=4577 RepID=A0A1D6G7H4_MAIZE|nr:wound-responsive family protein [Zea mays]